MRDANLNRIVVLEPQELFLDYLVGKLNADGLHVAGAATKMDDAELAALRPDTVLVDIAGSDVTAFAVLGRVRKAVPQARVVAFGGSSAPAWRAGAWAQGADALLTENDGPEAFVAAVKAA